MDWRTSERSAGAKPTPNQPRQPRLLEAEELFRGQSEVRLLHRGQEYRLRITRQGKLILTK